MADVDLPALALDAALLTGWSILHSATAAEGFKRATRRLVPACVERLAYNAISVATVVAVMAWWRPLPRVVYSVEGPAGLVLMALGFAGGALLLAGARAIALDELLGIAQWRAARRGLPPPDAPFLDRGPHSLVRHPLYLGLLALGWGTPAMTAGRLLLCAVWTAYLLVGARLEERKLVRAFGQRYLVYRRRVPMLLPWPRPRGDAGGAGPAGG